ncbi:MAG: hypothetical protein AAF203_07240, partial [Pseudomonadota bacterium]
MKTLVIGGTKDFGLEVTDFFAPESTGIGRSNGYDISSEEIRKKIISESLNYDLVIALASGNNHQGVMVEEIAIRWLTENHSGYLISFGSTAIFHDN